MEQGYTITFTNYIKGDMTLQLTGDMTISEMKIKYCSKILEPPEKFGQTIFLVYSGAKLDLNSNEPIRNKFKPIDQIYVYYEEGDNSEKQVNEIKKDINKRQAKNRIRKVSVKKDEKDEEKVEDTLEDMALLGSAESMSYQIDKKKQRDKYIEINKCLESNDDQFFILGILAKYLENLGIKPIIEKADVTKDDEEQNYANTLLQFVSNGYILKHKYIIDFGFNPERIEELNNNKESSLQFHNNLKKHIVNAVNLKEEDLLITQIKKNDYEYIVILIFKSELKNELSENNLFEIIKKNKHFKQIKSVKKEFIMETIKLNRSMLDERGNNKSDSNWGYDEERGGEPYYPPEGCHRYGLRVFGKYDNKNNDWLSYDNRPGEWCIAYSGLGGNIKKNTKSYEEDDDLKNYGKKVGSGVICYTRAKIMMENTEEVNANGVNYKIGLMLRVNPGKIRKPSSDKNVWVVNGTSDAIRPYGILLRKI